MAKTTSKSTRPIVEHMLFGRRKIFTSVDEITPANVLDVLEKSMITHLQNRAEIEYLYRYYKGDQPILRRIKKIRPDICNNIVVNRANEIVTFKVGYQTAYPMIYTAARADANISKDIELLNNLMAYENKAAKDKSVIEWQMICGTAYKIALPDKNADIENDEAPFSIVSSDPTNTFAVYSNRLKQEQLMGVTYWAKEIYSSDGQPATADIFAIYTKKWYFEVSDGKIIRQEPNRLGMIPIIEYPANNARLGAFEIVIDLLDALSKLESTRLDGTEQFVQSFLKFINCDIDREQYEQFLEDGAIKVNSHEGKNADVALVTSELSQTGAQTQVDDIYDTILTICGMPNRNGGSSTSDTGMASYLRDGWNSAESFARSYETMFDASERELLKVVLKILNEKNIVNLKVSDIEMRSPRRNYENMQTKAQVLNSMLNNPKIHPRLAFELSDMFPDPETAYDISEKYYREQIEAWDVKDVGDSDRYVSDSGSRTGEDTE